MGNKKSVKGQVTIFIIIAVVIVAAAIVFFVARNNLGTGTNLPVQLEPVYNNFLNCLEENTATGIDILGSQGGYIYINKLNFEPGSNYMPFSSQLNFLGNPIPYWYYVSGNNLPREQVPSKENMEKELAEFISEKIAGCDFDSYYEKGFEVSFNRNSDVKVKISENTVDVNLFMAFEISDGEETAIVENHKVIVKSNIGELYAVARNIYNEEQKNLFLEERGIDILRLYAPVDGVELQCGPKIWEPNKVFDELQNGIEANTLALKVKGGDFSLKKEENKYFVLDLPANGKDVRFINSKNWANSFEVSPSQGDILVSNPVGNQPGLGVLGFCYVPYHFVYDVKYPVLIQVEDKKTKEIFQFPVAVIIQGNNPRKALDISALDNELVNLCEFKNTNVRVNVYDERLNKIEADISYECFGTFCSIGKTENGFLEENFPQCANGRVIAQAKGFEQGSVTFSTTNSGSVDVILDKLYDKKIDLRLDGVSYNGDAIVSFVSEGNVKTISWPLQKTLELKEGQYEIQVYVYKSSSLKFDERVVQQCVEIPRSGLGGVLGFKREECFDIRVPSQIISNSLAGGGKQNHYILESDLSSDKAIIVNAQSLPVPSTIDDLQKNNILFERRGLEIL